MVNVYDSLGKLNFRQLMDVYVESNLENGLDRYPQEPEMRRLQLAEEDFYRYLREMFFSVPGNVYMVLEDGGRYVSALRLETWEGEYLVAGLETMPQVRCRGYGKKLIQEAVDWLQSRGKGKLYSHVSKRNQPSLETHRACGFQVVQDCVRYLDGSVSHRAVTLCLDIPHGKSE